MKPETIAKARTMLSSVLLDGLSYREAGAPFGVGRSTVERSIKSLVLEVARERGIPELDENGLSCLPRLRQFREPARRSIGTASCRDSVLSPVSFSVAAVRETSVLFAVALGAIVLHERVTVFRAVGAALVVAGVAVVATA